MTLLGIFGSGGGRSRSKKKGLSDDCSDISSKSSISMKSKSSLKSAISMESIVTDRMSHVDLTPFERTHSVDNLDLVSDSDSSDKKIKIKTKDRFWDMKSLLKRKTKSKDSGKKDKTIDKKQNLSKKERIPSFTVPRNPYKYKYSERPRALAGMNWTPFHTSVDKHHCGVSADNLLGLNQKISTQLSEDMTEISTWFREQKVYRSRSMDDLLATDDYV